MHTIKSLYYHNPSVQGFEKMVAYYQKRGYRFIDLQELYDILGKRKPLTEKLAFVSFDDGWQGNLQLISIIERYQVPICIFVATEPLESGNFWWEYVAKYMGVKKMFQFKNLPYGEFYKQLTEIKQQITLNRSAMTKEQMIDLAKHPLVTIQSHTVNHPILTNSPDDVLDMELKSSKETLEAYTGNQVYAFSYPNGSLTSREVDACKRYYKLAFTTEQRHIKLSDDLYLLPRYALTGQYYRDLLKVWGVWKWIRKIFKH